MSSDFTPPPRMPLRLVIWHGLEPGYYVLLFGVFLFGLLFFLFDMTWGRLCWAAGAFAVTIILMLPYRGLRLWQYSWRRLCQGWAIVLARLHPERRQQLALLFARLDPTLPDQSADMPAACRLEDTRRLPPAVTRRLRPADDPPRWDDAWQAAAWAQPPSRASLLSLALPLLPPAQLTASLPGDELDGSPPMSGGQAQRSPGAGISPQMLTLRQIRAWSHILADEREGQ